MSPPQQISNKKTRAAAILRAKEQSASLRFLVYVNEEPRYWAASAFEELVAATRARRVILFAGAGVSMSVGLPSWTELIKYMRAELGLPDEHGKSGVTYQTLAEFYRLRQGSIGPLRSWMDRTWSVSEAKVRKSKIHDLIVGLEFPIIYTTNYDNNLEVAYKLHGREFVKITNVRDMVRATDGMPQIVKFHGDFSDDQSLVLAETDYFDRLEFNSPLDIKFRSDTLGRTLLFIGYSMSDLNIRLLLHRLWKTWQASGREKDRPRSFLFAHRPNPVQTAVLEQWGITVLSERSDDPEEALLSFLSRLREASSAPED